MRPMRNIVVPLDGSVFAESALPMALDVARRAAARVTLVTVFTPALPRGGAQGVPALDPRLDRELRADILTYHDLLRRRLVAEAHDVAGIDTLVLDGPVAETLAEYVDEAGADLVVLTSHGRGGASRFWLGSVTDALVRRLDAPALVARPAAGPTPPSGAFHRVLVPIDGSAASAQGAEAVVGVIGTLGVEYVVLRVVTAPPLPFAEFVSTEAIERDAVDRHEAALGDLAAVERRLRDHGADVRGVVRFHRSASEAIVEYAGEVQADLVALATHGRGPVGRLLFGSVTDKVLRTAAVPVLVRHAGVRHAGSGALAAARDGEAVGAPSPAARPAAT